MASEAMPNWLLYGATGYTGELIAREAVKRGERPILAGRHAEAVGRLGSELNCPVRVAALDDPVALAKMLSEVGVLLNCAGPFAHTAPALIDACIAAKVHYLDITGELDVIELAAQRGAAAAAAGVTLMPAVGFDVVPSDCLAAMLKERLPGAVRLELAFTMQGRLSRGTAKTVLAALPGGGRVRVAGRIEQVPFGFKTMEVPFRDRSRWVMTIAWGDVSSAYYTTGIENIAVFTAVPKWVVKGLPAVKMLLEVFKRPAVARFLSRQIDRLAPGPDEAARAKDKAQLWGRVVDRAGNRASATLETPGGYALTILTALECVKRAGAGGVATGFLTPAKAFGPQFICEFSGVSVEWPSAGTSA